MIRIAFILVSVIAALSAVSLFLMSGRVSSEYRKQIVINYFVIGKIDLPYAVASIENAQSAEANWIKLEGRDGVRSGSVVVVFVDNPHKAPIEGNLEVWLPFSDAWIPVSVASLGMAKRSLYVVDCGDLVTWSTPVAETIKRSRWRKIKWLN